MSKRPLAIIIGGILSAIFFYFASADPLLTYMSTRFWRVKHPKHYEGALAFYTPQNVVYNAVPPLRDLELQYYILWLKVWERPIELETREDGTLTIKVR